MLNVRCSEPINGRLRHHRHAGHLRNDRPRHPRRLRRAGPLAVELLVVDNGSNDDTAAVLPREFPQIQLIRSETNLGFARAVNRAAQSAHGEFLLLLNSDARAEPDALARAVAWMRAHPDCAVAGAQLLNADGSRQNSIANFPTLATELLNKSLLRRLWPERFPGKEQVFTAPVDVETVVGAFMLIRRLDWDAHGGLDERFLFFFEETDFCRQVRRAGRRVVHLPEVRVWHEQGATAKKVSAAARIEYWRSRYAYFKKIPISRRGRCWRWGCGCACSWTARRRCCWWW